MSRPKAFDSDVEPLQLRMPAYASTEIKVDAAKWVMTNAQFVAQTYSYARENGLYKWLSEKPRHLPEEPTKHFQVHLPTDIAMPIKVDAMKYKFKHGWFFYVVYLYAKKHGLYEFLKK